MFLRARVRHPMQLVILISCFSGANIGRLVHARELVSRAAEEAIAPTDSVITLFDGKTLGDCYTWLQDSMRDDPRKVFGVTNGLLHITGDGYGGLLTNERYHDYHLILEFAWGKRTWKDRERAARDSGLLIHCNGADGGFGGVYMPGIEVQIIEGGGW